MASEGHDPNSICKTINDMLNNAPGTPSANTAPTPGAGDELFMGLTLSGLLLAGLFSLVGMAFVIYARKQGRLIVGVCGVALMAFTYFITNTWLILLIGTLLSFLPLILKRFDIDL
ncbi:MAG: hypothetical protein JXR97_04305 [Planctomycetes bacterium]|nr:hypothetical protein [Planctomycetota bacterium]